MLIPKRVKHRKQHHPSRKGGAKGGTDVTFGEYGIQALEPAYITNRQGVDQHLPGPPADQEARRGPHGFR